MEKIKELFEQDVIITGVDQGNKSAKFSYLDEGGNIESFAIPTVVAPAEEKRSSIEGNTSSTSIEKRLHLKIQSKSVSTANQERYVHVGHYARNKEGREEPSYEQEKKQTSAKFSNDLHIITTLAGLAVIAVKTGKDMIHIPYAGGLPVNEMKELGSDQAFESVKGTHHVTFIDGPAADKKVTIVIEKGKMYGEGAITDLSLNFDIVNGEVVETSLSDRLTDNYVLADLGAGTTDVVVFTDDGIDGSLSQSLDIGGTNPFIDRMMEKVNDLPEYQEMKELLGMGEEEMAYRSREDFMSEVIEPAIISYIQHDLERPTFEVNLMNRKTVDVTDIVMVEIEKYAEKHKADLNRVWNNTGTDDLVLVGGGLLFGYPVFQELQESFREKLGSDWAIFPDHVEESPFFTSRGYLIANYMNTVHEEETEDEMEEVIK